MISNLLDLFMVIVDFGFLALLHEKAIGDGLLKSVWCNKIGL